MSPLKPSDEAREERERKNRFVQKVNSVGVWDWDLCSGAISFNQNYYQLMKLNSGSPHSYADFLAMVHPDDREAVDGAMASALTGQNRYEATYRVTLPSGVRRWMRAEGITIFNDRCEAIRIIGVVQDMTGTQHTLQRQELLLGEAHHRIKNSLSTVASLLRLQSTRSTPEVKAALHLASQRVTAIALQHEHLQSGNGVDRIKIKAYLQNLCNDLIAVHDSQNGDLRFEGSECSVPAQWATSVGLIVNELVSNAFKHGGREERQIIVDVLVETGDKILKVRIADNGEGLPEDFDMQGKSGLGFQLVTGLLKHIKGTLEVVPSPGNGACFLLKAPIKRGEQREWDEHLD